MRVIYPAHLSQPEPTQHPLRFQGERGEFFQIDVLNHDLIRVRHYPEGEPRLNRTWMIAPQGEDVPLQGRMRDDLSIFPLPPYGLYRAGQHVTVQTEKLHLTIHLEDFRLEWRTASGQQPFAADVRKRAYAYDRAGKNIFHYMERRKDEHYYGFGERAGVIDKTGMRMRMLNLDALGYNAETGDPLYKHFPFYITYIPELKLAYGLLYDNLATTIFDMGKELDAYWGSYRYYAADDGDIDYYLIYGPSIEAVVEKMTALTGRPTLPPRWSLGYLGSTMKYTEAPDAQEQLKRFAELCQQHDIPCDLFHLSSGYTTDDEGRRCVFTWNRSRVPDPPKMARDFHEAGIRLAANIKPYMLKTHPYYKEVQDMGGFVKDAVRDEPVISTFWSGGKFESGEGGYIDFTSAAGYSWWKSQVTEALLKVGIDSAWNDNNEFEIWDDAARCAGFGEELSISLARPLQTLLMGRASYEALIERNPDQRPFVLSRSGCPGIQRYAQTWSGDNETSWHSLKFNIPMGLGMSLSGAPNTGHDVGGFHGPAPDPELFVRWVQNGVFHPRFTIHSWNNDGTVNEPWMYPDVLPIIREWIQFRYRIMPYLYSVFFEAWQTGHPIIRPMVYHYPDDPRCHTESFDFMLGENLLIASVFEPGARKRTVYLPGEHQWCDFATGQWYEGGQTIEVDAPLERIPLFVPDGGMIPATPRTHFKDTSADTREVYVFPHSATRTFTLIEDDGVSFGYRRGEYSEIRLTASASAEQITLKAEQIKAGYTLPYKEIEFILPAAERRPANGAETTDAQGRRHITVGVEQRS